MVCSTSCAVSAIFLIGMIYFYNATDRTHIVQQYKRSLTPELQARYEKITKERRQISLWGYGVGILVSLFILYYNFKIKKERMNTSSIVCLVVATTFVINALFYMVYPKSDWMLNHVTDKQQVRAWLQMYKSMSFYYHFGLVLGVIAVGFFAFAFRC